MKTEKYEEFLHQERQGLKNQAAESLRSFIDSFQDGSEIESWVWEFLPKLEKNHHSRIRYEIFRELVYPVLKRGYLADDFESTLWLGKLIQNIYNVRKIDEDLGDVTDKLFFLKCYSLNPGNEEVRDLLLKNIVKDLQFSVHEWPAGILYGSSSPNQVQCQELREEAAFAVELDAGQKYSVFFGEFAEILSEYEARLSNPARRKNGPPKL